MNVWRTSFVLLGFLTAGIAHAEQNINHSFPLSGHGILDLKTPVSWRVEETQRLNGQPPTIKFSQASGSTFAVLVTPLWQVGTSEVPESDGEIKRATQESIAAIAAHAVEKDIKLNRIVGAAGSGYYYQATDSSADPGDYKYLAQGAIRVNGLTVSFSILTNDGYDRTTKIALAALQSAVVRSEKTRMDN